MTKAVIGKIPDTYTFCQKFPFEDWELLTYAGEYTWEKHIQWLDKMLAQNADFYLASEPTSSECRFIDEIQYIIDYINAFQCPANKHKGEVWHCQWTSVHYLDYECTSILFTPEADCPIHDPIKVTELDVKPAVRTNLTDYIEELYSKLRGYKVFK